MIDKSNEKHLKLSTPATYRIEVEGHLAESWSDRLAGMGITTRKRLDQTTVTTLVGRLRDQAELSGVLNIDEEDTRKAVEKLQAYLQDVDQTVDQVDKNEK